MSVRAQRADAPTGAVLRAGSAGIPVDVQSGIGNGPVVETGVLGVFDALGQAPVFGAQAVIENPIAAAQVAGGVILTIGSFGTASAAGIGLIGKGLPTLVAGTVKAAGEGGALRFAGVDAPADKGIAGLSSGEPKPAGGVVPPVIPTTLPAAKPKVPAPDLTPSTPASGGGSALALGAIGLAALKVLAII